MDVQQLRNKLEQRKGQLSHLQQTIASTGADLRDLKRKLRKYEQAREIIREVGIKTQQQLQYHISDITSLALNAVFPDPYTLEVEFVQRRNKTECDLYFARDGNRVDPITASGGGAVDVAAFALRIAAWSMQRPHSRNTIILDEPLRFLSADLQEYASQMIKELSQKLGIQFIIITHNDVLTSYADKVFRVSISKGKSQVNE